MNRKVFIVLTVLVSLVVVATVSAAGAMQISGIGYIPDAEEEECEADVKGPEGRDWDFSNRMEGDLEGCLYVFVGDYSCSPGGVYLETGTELFVDENGTFQTTYRFSAKFDNCDAPTEQFFGRCQHPIVADSGKGYYDGVTGRLDFKDDLEEGNFPYTGHLRW